MMFRMIHVWFLLMFSTAVIVAGCNCKPTTNSMLDVRYIDDLFLYPVVVQTVSGHVSPQNQIREELDRQTVLAQLRRFLEADPSALPSLYEVKSKQSMLRPIDYWACVYANLHDHDFLIALHWTDEERDTAIQQMLDEVP